MLPRRARPGPPLSYERSALLMRAFSARALAVALASTTRAACFIFLPVTWNAWAVLARAVRAARLTLRSTRWATRPTFVLTTESTATGARGPDAVRAFATPAPVARKAAQRTIGTMREGCKAFLRFGRVIEA